ncbi:MAG TPA: NAD(P)-dependent oxidoreductase [Ramlibacter sp.]|nr:NAD(P)-dependent oxidoreductase [Ramlibacter sp.]
MQKLVAVVGLGRMGQAIASRLLHEGCQVTVSNRTLAAGQALAARGARIAATPADAARETGVALSMLTNEDAVRDVCFGPTGLLATLAGGVHLSMSTLSPAAAASLAAAHAEAGVTYVSAPVQGRPAMAEAGQLVAWVSGPFPAEARAVLEIVARQVIFLGPDVQHAAAAKLALNLLMNANIELFAEAFAYAQAHGVDVARFGQGLTESAFSAPLFKAIAGALAAADDTAKGSDIDVSRKDLGLLLAHGHRNLSLPVAVALENAYAAAAARGWGELDPIAVRRLLQSSEGTP